MDVLRFVIGTAIGSFINVLALRYNPEHSLFTRDVVTGRSHCPSCRRELRWFELIPLLSFVLQGGRCRRCRTKLAFQYPIVELLCGIIFVAVPYSPHGIFSPEWFSITLWILVLTLLVLIALIDLRESVIPNGVTLSLAIVGMAQAIFLNSLGFIPTLSFLGYYASLFGLQDSVIMNRLGGAAAGLLLFGLIFILSRGKGMGMGDVKLMGALGLLFGWPDILLISMLSFVSGAVVNAPALIRGAKRMKDVVPFGPFIVFAATMVFFFGQQIIHWYFKIFGIV